MCAIKVASIFRFEDIKVEFLNLPDPLGAAIHFVEKTNETRAAGIEVDTAQILAAKAACVTLRDYFARLQTSIADGAFDPEHIAEQEKALFEEM